MIEPKEELKEEDEEEVRERDREEKGRGGKVGGYNNKADVKKKEYEKGDDRSRMGMGTRRKIKDKEVYKRKRREREPKEEMKNERHLITYLITERYIR